MDFLLVVSFLPMGGMSIVIIGLYAWCGARGLAMKEILYRRNERGFLLGGSASSKIKFGHGTPFSEAVTGRTSQHGWKLNAPS